MTLAQTIILVIASLALVKGILVTLFPKQLLHLVKYYTKNPKNMRKAGFIGIIAAVILFIVGNLL